MWSAEGARRPALAGALLALATVLGLVETALLPPLPVPGVKLGLANVAVLISMITLGSAWTLAVTLGRVAIVGAVTGTLLGPAGALSLSGALVAWAVMTCMEMSGLRLSTVGLSVGGAAAHVTAQFAAAWAMMGVFLGPGPMGGALLLSAATGLAIGMVTSSLLSRLRDPLISRSLRTAEVRAGGATAGS